MREVQKPSNIQAAKRGIWFFMRTLALIAALGALGYSAFTMAMRASNLYILATEGLQLRAECILKNEISPELTEYFTETFVAEDKALRESAYADYVISGFDYRVEVEGVTVWPWSNTGTVKLVDRMASLNGALEKDKRPEGAPEDSVFPPPEWESGRYYLRFRLQKGRWYVYQMQLVEPAPSLMPLRTPDMSLTPIEITPTPSPTLTLTPSPGPTLTPAQENE